MGRWQDYDLSWKMLPTYKYQVPDRLSWKGCDQVSCKRQTSPCPDDTKRHAHAHCIGYLMATIQAWSKAKWQMRKLKTFPFNFHPLFFDRSFFFQLQREEMDRLNQPLLQSVRDSTITRWICPFLFPPLCTYDHGPPKKDDTDRLFRKGCLLAQYRVCLSIS